MPKKKQLLHNNSLQKAVSAGVRMPKKKGLLQKRSVAFVDNDFVGNWDKTIAAEDRATARLRHGYVITYAGCPSTWKSQLQMEIAL
jgi:hypothetical protein